MTLRRWTPLALLALLAVGLSACTTFGYPGYPGGGYPGDRYPGPGRPYPGGDYRQTPEYRSIGREADRYTDLLDRELGLNGTQERSIEALLERRAEGLLRNTHPRDHRYVYPFPRDQRLSAAARRWWDDTDREINRYLDRRQRDEYRYIARDLERYGRYDGRRYGRDRYYDRDGRYDRDGNRGDRGPAFCRSGEGHPVFGRRWCTDRGYYPDRGWGG
ncbi:MAG TPA: hypothetical protein VK002_14985 [Rubricoccaceae bacterium]|nr:hypothetical protein [Rubricoccaceae bacterium]